MRAYAIFAIFVVLLLGFAMHRLEPASSPVTTAGLGTGQRVRREQVTETTAPAGYSSAAADETQPVGPLAQAEIAPQVLLRFEVVEVNRTKLHTLGVNFATTNTVDVSTPANVRVATIADVFNASTPGSKKVEGFRGLLTALKQDQLAKVLAEPTIVTTCGRPVHFRVGQEVDDHPARQGEEARGTSFYGTTIDCEVTLRDDGKIALDGRIQAGHVLFDTNMALQSGELGVVSQCMTREEAVRRGDQLITQKNEIECLLLITPELVEQRTAAMPDHQPRRE